MWLCLLAGRSHRPLPGCDFGRLSGDEKLAGWGGRISVFVTSKQHIWGRWGSKWDPRRDSHIKEYMSPSAPRTFNFVERKAKTARRKTHLKAQRASVLLCMGVFFSVTLPVFHFNIKHCSFSANQASVLTNPRDEQCAAVCRINMKERGPTVLWESSC